MALTSETPVGRVTLFGTVVAFLTQSVSAVFFRVTFPTAKGTVYVPVSVSGVVSLVCAWSSILRGPKSSKRFTCAPHHLHQQVGFVGAGLDGSDFRPVCRNFSKDSAVVASETA